MNANAVAAYKIQGEGARHLPDRLQLVEFINKNVNLQKHHSTESRVISTIVFKPISRSSDDIWRFFSITSDTVATANALAPNSAATP